VKRIASIKIGVEFIDEHGELCPEIQCYEVGRFYQCEEPSEASFFNAVIASAGVASEAATITTDIIQAQYIVWTLIRAAGH
jgi:hypothetical protein